MGGLGSGRAQQHQYDRTADEGPRIDVRRGASNLPRKPGDLRFHSWRIDAGNTVLFCDIDYHQVTVEAQVWKRRGADLEHKATQIVRLTTTLCNFGSLRWWLVCPKCERRVAVLYAKGNIACRNCSRLKYGSQRLSPSERAAERLQQLRRRLGGPPGLLLPFPSRPKGMHHRKYVEALRDATRLLEVWDVGCRKMFRRSEHQLGRLIEALN